MKHLSCLSLALFVISLTSCSSGRPDQPPDLDGMVVIEAFHRCTKCDSMIGGIHGKGPTKSFDGENRGQCVHDWNEINRETFLSDASKIHGIDWSAEPAFYWNPREE